MQKKTEVARLTNQEYSLLVINAVEFENAHQDQSLVFLGRILFAKRMLSEREENGTWIRAT